MQIDGRQIGSGDPPWVCAEISGEHCGKLQNALTLVRAAKDAGADAVKLQCFDPLKLSESRGGADKVLTEGLWAGRVLYDLYLETYTPRPWFPELVAYAKDIGITMFSSVFDEEGVDYLEGLGCPAYKIASPEITAHSLINRVARTGKPIIISTGMASDEDAKQALIATLTEGPPGVIYYGVCALLHCISAYPCTIEDARLGRIRELAESRRVPVGLSDHTLGSIAPVVATALGACIIEKHITLDRSNGGPDAPFSLEPAEFARMVQDVRDAYASLGTGERPASEAPYRELRRKG